MERVAVTQAAFGETEVVMRSITSLTLLVLLCPVASLADPSSETLPKEARTILKKAPTVVLYSLDPAAEEQKGEQAQRHFGWKVLGKTTLKRSDEAGLDLLRALDRAIGKGRGAKCFDPRHAIHAEYDGKKLDLVICFACNWVYVYLDQKDDEPPQVLIDASAEPVFDRILRDAKIPLAKKK
jgi:hypothetical protein